MSLDTHAGNHLLNTFDDPTPSSLSYFGSAVAIDGDSVLVASMGGSGTSARPAQAHLFDASNGALLQTFTDPASPRTSGLDISAAIDGGYVVIATGRHREVQLFDTSSGSHLRSLKPEFIPSGNFGSSVALSGNRLRVGASPRVSSSSHPLGEAYLFDVANGDLLHYFSDPTMLDGDHFGQSVAIDGSYLVIGSRGNPDVGTGVGQVHVYDTNTGGLLHTLEDPQPSLFGSNSSFGSLVAIDGNRVLVSGGLGRVNGTFVDQTYLFDALTGGLLETFVQPADSDVSSIAIHGSRVLVGGPRAYLITA